MGRTAANAAYAWAGTAQDQPNVLNGLNQYVSVNAVAYGYDARGNLTSGPKTFTYDAQDRLLTVSGSPSTTLSYDPPGRLYQTAAATTTRFLYDGSDLIAEYDASGNVLRRYVHGPGTDEPLVWYEGADSSSRRWLLADERGSIFAAATSSAARQFTNTYDEYGVGAAANTGRFQYTGQAWIAEAGVYNYKARDYLPGIGTFLQTDPAGYDAGMNLYGYVGGDPVNGSDPSGMVMKAVHVDNEYGIMEGSPGFYTSPAGSIAQAESDAHFDEMAHPLYDSIVAQLSSIPKIGGDDKDGLLQPVLNQQWVPKELQPSKFAFSSILDDGQFYKPYQYKLENSDGQILDGPGYSVQENITYRAIIGSIPVNQAKDPIPVENGYMNDNVGYRYKQEPWMGASLDIVHQTFNGIYRELPYPLSTVFEHYVMYNPITDVHHIISHVIAP